MRISGQDVIPYPVEQVWEALLDPGVLVRTIPGCERLETTGDNAYAMTVTAGVAAIRGTYDGTCALSDLSPHQSLVMRLQGAGAPGTIDATVQVGFEATAPGETRISYDADAVVGGMVGGVGQRMLGSVSKRMAGEFFGNVANAIASPAGPVAAPGSQPGSASEGGAVGQVFTAPARPASSQQDFVKGIAVGAGLVLLGVLAGRFLGRRG
ncbi:MAG: carbon monoxide dehydrogenase subunit G [Nocardioides sp.]